MAEHEAEEHSCWWFVMDCPACDGQLELLGQLATREHYRCRNCGADCSRKLQASVVQELAVQALIDDVAEGLEVYGDEFFDV